MATSPLTRRSAQEDARRLLAVLTRIGYRLRQHVRASGTSLDQFRALKALERGALRASDLAQRASVSAAATTRFVDTLVRGGLVRRVEDARDRRVVLLALTPRGRRALARVEDLASDEVAALLGRARPSERALLAAAARVLGRVLDETEREEER